MKLCKVMAVQNMRFQNMSSKKDVSQIQAAQMNFLEYVKGCTRNDRIRNDVIRGKLGIFSVKN